MTRHAPPDLTCESVAHTVFTNTDIENIHIYSYTIIEEWHDLDHHIKNPFADASDGAGTNPDHIVGLELCGKVEGERGKFTCIIVSLT